MQTSKEYKDNIKRGVVTLAMVEDALYSLNKRAKNYRDQEKYYRRNYHNDKYGNVEKCNEKKRDFYEKKSDILKYCHSRLVAIHSVSNTRIVHIDENQDEYYDYPKDDARIIRRDMYWDGEECQYVNYIVTTRTTTSYFLYYEFPNFSFHSPIEKQDIKNYQDLPIIELEELTTYGKDINSLLSCQFCNKIHQLLINGAEIIMNP